MRRLGLIVGLLLCSFSVWAQTDVERIYRYSFTARYEGLAGGEPVREVGLSSDSTRVGYVRDNNLWVKDLSTGREWSITSDGEHNKVINGATDWVYEEEYGFTRAWTFSPSGSEISWLRFDESAVREYTLLRYDSQLYPTTYAYKYPKAGERNSVVTLWVCDLVSGVRREISTDADYIPHLGYTPTGELYFYRVNRLQNRFEVVLGDRVIYAETSPTYVERPDAGTITFQEDGAHFVARNETRTGWWTSDLWHVDRGFVRELSRDETAPIFEEWREKVTDGREFFEFENEGFMLYGWMIKPANFNPAKKYPVLMTQYSGPGSESVFVENLSASDKTIYDPLLAAGYVIACIDPRGTGGRGEAFKKSTYGQLGHLETLDQIAAARYLAGLDFVDGERIGIYGWSYGGFIALNCVLKGVDIFKAAVAVAPVTSWRFYDTIYTETYNGLPQDNPHGYDDNSPINYAGLLRGKLLLVHGTGDDNVHPQNTLEMSRALVAANKQFDMMLYTDANHSMRPGGESHVRQKIVEWVKENL